MNIDNVNVVNVSRPMRELFSEPDQPFQFSENVKVVKRIPQTKPANEQDTVTALVSEPVKKIEDVTPVQEKAEDVEEKVICENDNPPVITDDGCDSEDSRYSRDRHASYGRIWSSDEEEILPVKICTPFSNVLMAYAEDAYYDKSTVPPLNVKIGGTGVARGRSAGIWTEGGSTEDKGVVLLATSPTGDKLPPISVFYNANIVNGRHALVRVWNGCYIILGSRCGDKYSLAVYLVNSVMSYRRRFVGDNGDSYSVDFNCSLVAYGNNGNITVRDKLPVPWSREHPAIEAAVNMLFTKNASDPIYVMPYRAQRFESDLRDDFNSCVRDTDFMNTLHTYSSIDEAYAECEKVMASAVRGIYELKTYRTQRALLNVYVVYDSDNDNIKVYLVAVKYDIVLSSSSEGGRLWYGRVILREGDSFYYPDQTKEDALSYDVLVRKLAYSPYNGKAMLVLRRMIK